MYGFATFLKTPYSKLNYSNLSPTHNRNHLEPLEKIESPQLASLALGANKQHSGLIWAIYSRNLGSGLGTFLYPCNFVMWCKIVCHVKQNCST